MATYTFTCVCRIERKPVNLITEAPTFTVSCDAQKYSTAILIIK